MELTAEQITELGLTDENSPKVSSFLSDQIAEAKKDFNGKANKDAENILTGASEKIRKDTSIERNQGEKMGDYITRAWDEHNVIKTKKVTDALDEYNTKIRDFKGDKDLITKISSLEGEKDVLLKKYANFDEMKANAEKYPDLLEKYESNKLQVAFSGVKPNFPDTVNRYEAEAKWGEFKSGILDKYTIIFDDDKWKAKLKSNEYTIKTLSELVDSDDILSKLSEGRKQQGAGGKQIEKIEIEGVPFPVPKDVDSKTKTELIKDYLTKTVGIDPMSDSWSSEFAKYNTLINNRKLKE